MSAYEPNSYWESLLAESFSESSVAYPQMSRALNAALYATLWRSVERALRESGAGAPGRVLDVGSGTGIWIEFWSRHHAHAITGADLTPTSVKRLRERWPSHTFIHADIGDAAAALPGGQDTVSAMSVLLHIVDDARFAQAFVNLAAALRPDGRLVLIEPVVVHRWWGPPFGLEANSKARPLASYLQAMRGAGLELEVLRPATALLSNVVDTRSAFTFRALRLYWELLMRGVGPRERAGTVAASVLGPADRMAVALARTGPSAKVVIARRTW